MFRDGRNAAVKECLIATSICLGFARLYHISTAFKYQHALYLAAHPLANKVLQNTIQAPAQPTRGNSAGEDEEGTSTVQYLFYKVVTSSAV